MSTGAIVQPEMTEDAGLADARERFLSAEPVGSGPVRDTILASWRRCRAWHISACNIRLSYVRHPDPDTPLSRNALPVLRDLRDNLEGQPISIMLTDARGVLLSRLTADRDLDRKLDRVQLLPGFSYAEELVGTNGIGTALESGQAAHVFGHEHYAEHLADLACAAAPVRHPISGKIIGVVDLTCWRKDAGPLLIALAHSTAGQITQALLNDTSAGQVQLLQEYLRACRHNAGIVFALNSDMVMMSHHARDVLDPGDQAALLWRATEVLADDHQDPVEVGLPSGATARMSCRPVRGEGRRGLPGGVVEAKLIELAAAAEAHPRRSSHSLVGSGPLWLRGCDQVDAAYCGGDWLALEGERGVGKLALLQAVHRRRNPAGALHVLDAAEAADHHWLVRALSELLEGEGSLVIRHVDRLSAVQLRTLSIALEEALAAGRQKVLWVAITLSQSPAQADLAGLLQFFPNTIELPPLRHHIDDLHKLVPFFLAKLNHHRQLVCSPETMQLLQRSSWPGNTEQLGRVLKQVVHHKRSGTIFPGDLPPECWTVSRRLLSPLESMERDAILQALLDSRGNKVKAARSLGMSRATIYRKIHEYGIAISAS
jgi:sigma-54 dependent transcriptional regulator, acetoin dehydrogenase operon transcriptional activator AcoR